MDARHREGRVYVNYHIVCVYHGNFLIFSPCSSPFLTPTLWQMVPHKSHTQISSQGNASLLLKRGTNVRWIWDEFALWIKFTGPRWLLPRVYQETTILLYFISYNSKRIFHIFGLQKCTVEGKCDAKPVWLLNTWTNFEYSGGGCSNMTRKRIGLGVRLITAVGVIVTGGKIMDRIHLC